MVRVSGAAGHAVLVARRWQRSRLPSSTSTKCAASFAAVSGNPEMASSRHCRTPPGVAETMIRSLTIQSFLAPLLAPHLLDSETGTNSSRVE